MKDFYKFVIRFALPYKHYVTWSIVFNILSTCFTIFSFAFIMPILNMLFGISDKVYSYMPIGSAGLSDVIINNFYYYISQIIKDYGSPLALALLCSFLLATTLVKTLTHYISRWLIIPVQNGLEQNIRDRIYNKLLSLNIGYFSTEKKGDIIARCTSDVKELQISVMSSIASIIRYPIDIVFSLGIMIYLSWQLTAFVAILIPVFGWIMGRIGKKIKARSLEAQTLGGSILANIEESIGGLRVIKSFNAEKFMNTRFMKLTARHFKVNNAVQRRLALAHPVSEFLGTIAVAIILWFGGSLILSGNVFMDASMFIFYLLMFYNIINPAKELSKALYTIQKGMAALQRIEKLFNADNPIKNPEKPVNEPSQRLIGVEFKNVTFAYDSSKYVISDFTLKINPGETVAIVGQSGAGKSTLADLISRFWDVNKGQILINGTDIRDYTVHDARDLIGNVSQEPILFNDTIFNNIAFGIPDATEEEVIKSAQIANAHDFIMNTEEGYNTIVGDRGCRLSGGQRQRISIARAILKNPRILVLDEATSALDTESERLVQKALEMLMTDRTTIIIAHRLSTIVNADKICVINDGRLAETGTHEQLMAKKGIYRKLVEMQQIG